MEGYTGIMCACEKIVTLDQMSMIYQDTTETLVHKQPSGGRPQMAVAMRIVWQPSVWFSLFAVGVAACLREGGYIGPDGRGVPGP